MTNSPDVPAPSTVRSPVARGRAVSIALQTDKTADEYARLAVAAEELDFDGVSVFADLGFQPPAAAMTVIARHTSRVRLGVACHSPTLNHPVELAGQIATLDRMSGGRAYAGIARGAWMDGFGLPAGDGLGRLAEAVAVIRAVLSGDDRGVVGRHFSVPAGFRLQYPLPARMPDLLIGTWGRRTAGLARELGANEVKIGGSANPDMVAVMRDWLGPDVGLAVGAVTVCDEDAAAARTLARQEVCLYLDVVAGLDPTVTVPPDALARMRERLATGDRDGAAAAVPDDILDRFTFAGDPEQIAAHALACYAAGADRVEFGTPHGRDPVHGVELLGRHVLPALRDPASRAFHAFRAFRASNDTASNDRAR